MSKSAKMAKQKQYGFTFREAIKKRIFAKQINCFLETGGLSGKVRTTKGDKVRAT